MFITVYISGIIITVPITRSLYTKNAIKSIVNLGEMGFKLNENILDANGEWLFIKDEKIDFLSKLTFYIPLVNIVTALGLRRTCMENLYLDAELKDALIPMTEDEQKVFDNAKSDVDKIKIITFDMIVNNIKRSLNENMVTSNCLCISNSPVLPLSYSYDEVNKFRSVSSNILFGESEGRNIALLVGNEDIRFNLLRFKNDSTGTKYEFNLLTDTEAQDKNYLIYPYIDIKEDDINEIVDEIRKDRANQSYYLNNYQSRDISKTLSRKK